MSEQSARQQRDVIAVALPGQPGQFVLIQQVPAEKDATDDDDTSHASSAAPDDGCGETPPANEDELYEDEECFHNESDVSCQSKLATPADEMVEFEEEIMRQKLSLRSYHFEGNNWCEDWQMYMKNNHLIFGLCCHHRLHPVRLGHRVILLLGSMTFGLVATNLVYLLDDILGDSTVLVWGDKIFNETVAMEKDVNIAGQNVHFDTTHLGLLWTIGSGAHSMFDFFLWHIIACGYCHDRNCETVGWSMAVTLVFLIGSITVVFIYFQAYGEGDDDDDIDAQFSMMDEEDNATIESAMLYYTDEEPDLNFLYGYLIELVLSLFAYTPMVQTLVFSGILGCGRIPVLGGRPLSIRRERGKAEV